MSTIKANQWLNSDGSENFKCRAWVNFNGTGTIAIRAAGNVSSITDNGAGDYTLNFINAMADTSYCAVIEEQVTGAGYGYWKNSTAASYTTTTLRFSTHSGDTVANTTPIDPPYVNVAIFR